MRVLQLLREHLETYAAPHPLAPVVRLIVGDDNLYAREARQELQRTRDEDPLWEVHPAAADRQGDHVAVNGAAATPIDISIGASFRDPGMRRDQHDAVAVRLRIPVASQPAENSTDRERDRDASQLAPLGRVDEEAMASGAARVPVASQSAEEATLLREDQPTEEQPHEESQRDTEDERSSWQSLHPANLLASTMLGRTSSHSWSDWKISNAGSYYHPRCYERIGTSIAGRL